jgi:hypothetical protein
MKKVFKFVLFLIVASGWALAASAVHVVRSPGTLAGIQKTEWAGQFAVIPKDKLGWPGTFVDTTKWTPTDVASNPAVVERISEVGRKDLLNHILEPAMVEAAKPLPPGGIEVKPTAAPEPEKTASPKAEPEAVEKTSATGGEGVQDSIFDFPEKK